MYLPDLMTPQLTGIAEQMSQLGAAIVKQLPNVSAPIELSGAVDFLGNQSRAQLYYLQDGSLTCERSGKFSYRIDKGNFIGISRAYGEEEGVYSADDQVTLIPITLDAVTQQMQGNPELLKNWTRYLVLYNNFLGEALVISAPNQFKPATGFLYFEAGETIINQGEEAECVYTLLEGAADALHDGVKVGEIHAEEMFGAMAVFTGQHRNASVIATEDCSVLAVRKEEFLDLVRYQPQVCVSLIEEMAEKINQLNRQVKSLQ